MLRKFAAALVLLVSLMSTGCYTNRHIVGHGAKGFGRISAKQWYAFWGLLPITSDPNINAMAAGAADYEIRTQFTFVDGLISLVTSLVTIAPRTVEVRK